MIKNAKKINPCWIIIPILLIVISFPALSNDGLSHMAIKSGLVNMSGQNERKAPIRFVKSELNRLLGLKRGLTSEEKKWMDEAPKALKKIYPNEEEYHKKLMELYSSKKFFLLESHSIIDRLLNSLNTNAECALMAVEILEERKCLYDMSQNMWWMISTYGHINNLRKNSKLLTGEFSHPDYVEPELFIYAVHSTASSISRIFEFSNRQQ